MNTKNVSFVRSAPIEAKRPPMRTDSLRAMIQAAFFSTKVNGVITIICLFLVVLILKPVLSWGILNATWTGDGAVCRENHDGACWSFIYTKMRFMFFGFYPREDQWRPAAVIVIVLGMLAASANPRFWRRELSYVWLLVIPMVFILLHGGVFGLSVHTTREWGGLPLTIVLSLVGLACGFPLGVILALGRRSKMAVIRNLCVAYIEIIRGVPLITVLFMSSVLFPLLLPEGAVVDKLLRAQVALIIFAAAYIAEIIRGGLQAIPAGQYEAAVALGLPYWVMMRKIILPQAIKIVIPALVNITIGFFKDTSLVIIIGLFDFLTAVKATLNDSEWIGIHIEAYFFAAFVYFLFCFTFSRYSIWLEKKVKPENVR